MYLYVEILTSINLKTQSTNALKFMIQFNGRKNRLYQISLQPIFLYIPPFFYCIFG